MSDLRPDWNKKKKDEPEKKEDAGRVGRPDFMGNKDKDEASSSAEQGNVGRPDFMDSGKKDDSAAVSSAAEAEMIGEHTVQAGDSLSAIALKYYGSAVRDKWMAIYEANKETIGENPSLIRAGQVLNIPKLDE